MIFNSVTYILFLTISVLCYYQLPYRPRLLMLCTGSVIFYGFWRWEYVILMLYSIFLDFICAQKIECARSEIARKSWLAVSLIGNLSCLFYFKYLGFTIDNLQVLVDVFGLQWRIPNPDILLPLGISFYTFQSLSYTIDVYRGFIKSERDFLLFASYIVFFPQLVAGPILRAAEVMPWLKATPIWNWDNLSVGVKRILNGLFLKVVLADNIAEFVDMGFATDTKYLSALDIWTLAFLFGFQIYFDFSAYSHIALGSAKLMGIDFPENFNFPYFATSAKEFWKRWHISLSSWIRDYLYLPLCGAKVKDESTGGISEAIDAKKARTALILTWAIMGMWHGANWTFLYWGFFHAAWVLFHRSISPHTKRLPIYAQIYGGWALTLLLAMASWIPFRAQDLTTALVMHAKLLSPLEYNRLGLRENTYIIAAAILLCMIVHFLAVAYIAKRQGYFLLVSIFSSLSYAVQFASVFVFLRPIKQFIYFQF
jgi:alginate O-acetyltransferase complex protein AlgI